MLGTRKKAISQLAKEIKFNSQIISPVEFLKANKSFAIVKFVIGIQISTLGSLSYLGRNVVSGRRLNFGVDKMFDDELFPLLLHTKIKKALISCLSP